MKVIVGISGGVDSAVCAWLLKRAGHEVIAVTMRTYDTPHAEAERRDAAAVAACLGIRHEVVDCREDFKEKVIDYFADAYIAGQTPNPCCVCNPQVKFDMLMSSMRRLGADAIASGHYAQRLSVEDPYHPGVWRYALQTADDEAKDQTYALYGLSQEQLAALLLPLGAYTKPQVRAMAAEAGLFVAAKRDSLDICFVPEGDYREFIAGWKLGFERRFAQAGGDTALAQTPPWNTPGPIVDELGQTIGWHRGLIHYTVGQRRGLNLPAGSGKYVLRLDAAHNTVYVGGAEALMSRQLECTRLHYQALSEIRKTDVIECKCKISYKDKGTECIVRKTARGASVEFVRPVRAVTPGQAVVFYRDGLLLGGGIII